MSDGGAALRLPSGRRGLVWTLAFGAFGLAFALTTTAAYLPPVLGRFTSSRTLIAAVLASEGIFAVSLPLVVGPWSDTISSRFGHRRPFMIVAVPVLGVGLVLLGFMPSLLLTTVVVLGFFAAYYVYEPPYRGLYPDLLEDRMYGRAQSVQHVMRGIALGTALVSGGFLLHLWRPGPFVAAAFVTVGACGITIFFIHEEESCGGRYQGVRAYVAQSWGVVRGEPQVRLFLFANACWEGTFAAMRTFVVLYITKGLGQPLYVSSAVLATVAAGYIVAAVASGPLGDRFGLARVIFYASFLYGGGLLVGGLARSWHTWYYGGIFPVAMAGGAVMTLSWGLLFKLMPERERGAISGLAETTKGIGLVFGPLVAGGAIDLTSPYLTQTNGYEILWPICGLPVLAAIPLAWRLRRAESASASGRPARTAG